MQGVLQSKGLLSLLSKPRTRAFIAQPSCDLRGRINFINPLLRSRTLNGSSVSFDGFSKFQGFVRKPLLVGPKNRNYVSCRAEAAATGDGQPLYGAKESPKFMGIELVSLKKIIPLGMMFFCVLFNYTILGDANDVLVVTAKGSSAEIIPFLSEFANGCWAYGLVHKIG